MTNKDKEDQEPMYDPTRDDIKEQFGEWMHDEGDGRKS